jgi:hypothetical protein
MTELEERIKKVADLAVREVTRFYKMEAEDNNLDFEDLNAPSWVEVSVILAQEILSATFTPETMVE